MMIYPVSNEDRALLAKIQVVQQNFDREHGFDDVLQKRDMRKQITADMVSLPGGEFDRTTIESLQKDAQNLQDLLSSNLPNVDRGAIAENLARVQQLISMRKMLSTPKAGNPYKG